MPAVLSFPDKQRFCLKECSDAGDVSGMMLNPVMSLALGAVLPEQHGFCREMQHLVATTIGLKCNIICTDLPLVSFLPACNGWEEGW